MREKRRKREEERGQGAEPRDCTAKMAELLYKEEVWGYGEERTLKGWRVVGVGAG